MAPPSSPPGAGGLGVAGHAAASGQRAHFRAHGRREVRLPVVLTGRGEPTGRDRAALVVDVSLAGAGLETDEPLQPGQGVSLAFATPNLWDPLVLDAVVAWTHPPRQRPEVDALGRPKLLCRSGVAFAYADGGAVLAMFEMLAALGYE